MKISVNWIRQFTDVNVSTEELIRKIGEQIGEVESVVLLGERYRGAVIVRVVSVEKHPNADKLSVCMVDDGEVVPDLERNAEGHIQVVCGAPNVHEGMIAVWLAPGVVVPNSFDNDPFTLEAREIRGVVSNGMLASSKELAIGDDHNGIVSVDVPVDPGTLFIDAYDLDDVIIDIENKMFTHRPDGFGILGVAREIAGVQHIPFHSPNWYLSEPVFPDVKNALPLYIENEIPDRVARFSAVAIDNISVGPSPLMLQTYLSRVGIRPINNVVDVTNYVMVLTGQPLHAYDAHKLVGVSGGDALKLEARIARKGDTLELLDGKTVEFSDEDESVLITTNDVPVGIGGVMGGKATEVHADTTRIVLEAATFDMYGIRRTSMRHGMFTDAVTRFNKGQSSLQTTRALKEAVAMLEQNSGGNQVSDLMDVFPKEKEAAKRPVSITPEFVSKRVGLDISGDEIQRIMENVEFTVHATSEEYEITPPFWRQDIEIAEDIIEEVIRLKGYDVLPVELPIRSLLPVAKNQKIAQKDAMRSLLHAAGANEVLTYSFVHKKLLEKSGQNSDNAYAITNALSPDLHYYRLSLTPSLLERVHANHKMGFKEFALFELGRVHQKNVMDEDEPGVPLESPRLSCVYSADEKHWNTSKGGAAYFQMLQYLNAVLDGLFISFELVPVGGERAELTAMQQQMIAPFDPGRSAYVFVDDVPIGVIGELRASVRRSMKLPTSCAAFELDVSAFEQSEKSNYRPLPKFPKIHQDISLKLSASTSFSELRQLIQEALERVEDVHSDLEPIDIFTPSDDASSKHFTFRIIAWSEQKTMRTEELSAILESIASTASEQLEATRL